MSLLSTLRAASWLARDIWPALQRLVTPPDDDNPDAYAEHLARVRADALAQREAQTEVTEPLSDCGLGEADECLCDGRCATDERICPVDDEDEPMATSDSRERKEFLGPYSVPKEVFAPPSYQHPDRFAQPPSASGEPAFTAWLASIDARLAAIQDHLTSAAPGDTFTPDAAPESPAPDPGAGAGQPGISNLDWALVFVGLEHLTRLSSDPDQWKALSDRISDALARSK